MDLPKRKEIRLKTYDYNSSGFYFITICTAERKPLFWRTDKTATVGAVERLDTQYAQNICGNIKDIAPNTSKTATVGAVIGRPQEAPLNEKGKIVEQAIKDIPKYYPMYYVDNYVIMPDHIHLLLQIIYSDDDGRPMTAPTISTVINQLKGRVTKQLGFAVWQKAFIDHIIRNEEDYRKHYNYIETNPLNRDKDEYYCP